MKLVLGLVLLAAGIALTWAAKPARGQELSRVMRVPLADPIIPILILVLWAMGGATLLLTFGVLY